MSVTAAMMPTAEPKPVRKKFELLRGQHIGWANEDLDKPGNQRRERKYVQGDIIVSDVDLCKTIDKHAKDRPKFRELPMSEADRPATQGGDTVQQPVKPKGPPVTYDEMMKKSLKELQDICAENEVELHGAVKKEELAKLIVATFG